MKDTLWSLCEECPGAAAHLRGGGQLQHGDGGGGGPAGLGEQAQRGGLFAAELHHSYLVTRLCRRHGQQPGMSGYRQRPKMSMTDDTLCGTRELC